MSFLLCVHFLTHFWITACWNGEFLLEFFGLTTSDLTGFRLLERVADLALSNVSSLQMVLNDFAVSIKGYALHSLAELDGVKWLCHLKRADGCQPVVKHTHRRGALLNFPK